MAIPSATMFPMIIYHFNIALLRFSDLNRFQFKSKNPGMIQAIITIKYPTTPTPRFSNIRPTPCSSCSSSDSNKEA